MQNCKRGSCGIYQDAGGKEMKEIIIFFIIIIFLGCDPEALHTPDAATRKIKVPINYDVIDTQKDVIMLKNKVYELERRIKSLEEDEKK